MFFTFCSWFKFCLFTKLLHSSRIVTACFGILTLVRSGDPNVFYFYFFLGQNKLLYYESASYWTKQWSGDRPRKYYAEHLKSSLYLLCNPIQKIQSTEFIMLKRLEDVNWRYKWPPAYTPLSFYISYLIFLCASHKWFFQGCNPNFLWDRSPCEISEP